MAKISTVYPDSKSQKWKPSGWRIEQKYVSGVLMGNWFENRLGKFNRGSHPSAGSTQREDYQHYSTRTYHPDVATRRKGLLMNDGLNKDHIFTHHGKIYFQNLISSYDQDYNRKYSVGIRHWNLKHCAWLHERSDHPLQGENTNFGLKKQREKERKEDQNLDTKYATEHSISYRCHPADTQTKRVIAATPRHLSARLHPHHVHKDLHLRNTPLIIRPEIVDPKFSDNDNNVAV